MRRLGSLVLTAATSGSLPFPRQMGGGTSWMHLEPRSALIRHGGERGPREASAPGARTRPSAPVIREDSRGSSSLLQPLRFLPELPWCLLVTTVTVTLWPGHTIEANLTTLLPHHRLHFYSYLLLTATASASPSSVIVPSCPVK